MSEPDEAADQILREALQQLGIEDPALVGQIRTELLEALEDEVEDWRAVRKVSGHVMRAIVSGAISPDQSTALQQWAEINVTSLLHELGSADGKKSGESATSTLIQIMNQTQERLEAKPHLQLQAHYTSSASDVLLEEQPPRAKAAGDEA